MKSLATEKYENGNREMAAVFLADPTRYKGIQLEWAKLWTAGHPISQQMAELPQSVVKMIHPQANLFEFERAA